MSGMDEVKAFLGKYPLIGMRTFKTVLAVVASSLFMMQVLDWNPFFACIGAVVAMEKSLSLSVKSAITRNVGTITGGLIGIAIGSFTENVYIMSLGLVPLIWINNLLGKKESIVPGAIVYFAVFYLNSRDQAWAYGLIRIAGTLIGTVIALIINRLVFPPKSAAAKPETPSKPPSDLPVH